MDKWPFFPAITLLSAYKHFFLLFLLFKFNIFYLFFLFYSRATEIRSFFFFFQFSISTSITITLVQYIFLLRQSHCVSRVKRIILLKFVQPTTYMGGYRLAHITTGSKSLPFILFKKIYKNFYLYNIYFPQNLSTRGIVNFKINNLKS